MIKKSALSIIASTIAVGALTVPVAANAAETAPNLDKIGAVSAVLNPELSTNKAIATKSVHARLTFDGKGRFFGNAGCNTVDGQYVIKGNRFITTDVASTKVGCDNEVMDAESALLDTLQDAHFVRIGSMLIFGGSRGSVVFAIGATK